MINNLLNENQIREYINKYLDKGQVKNTFLLNNDELYNILYNLSLLYSIQKNSMPISINLDKFDLSEYLFPSLITNKIKNDRLSFGGVSGYINADFSALAEEISNFEKNVNPDLELLLDKYKGYGVIKNESDYIKYKNKFLVEDGINYMLYNDYAKNVDLLKSGFLNSEEIESKIENVKNSYNNVNLNVGKVNMNKDRLSYGFAPIIDNNDVLNNKNGRYVLLNKNYISPINYTSDGKSYFDVRVPEKSGTHLLFRIFGEEKLIKNDALRDFYIIPVPNITNNVVRLNYNSSLRKFSVAEKGLSFTMDEMTSILKDTFKSLNNENNVYISLPSDYFVNNNDSYKVVLPAFMDNHGDFDFSKATFDIDFNLLDGNNGMKTIYFNKDKLINVCDTNNNIFSLSAKELLNYINLDYHVYSYYKDYLNEFSQYLNENNYNFSCDLDKVKFDINGASYSEIYNIVSDSNMFENEKGISEFIKYTCPLKYKYKDVSNDLYNENSFDNTVEYGVDDLKEMLIDEKELNFDTFSKDDEKGLKYM